MIFSHFKRHTVKKLLKMIVINKLIPEYSSCSQFTNADGTQYCFSLGECVVSFL